MTLQRVATYASNNKKSLAWAYKQIKLGKVKTNVIDGVIFIKVTDKSGNGAVDSGKAAKSP